MKKILILSANPNNTSRLRLDEEIREIKQGLQLATKRDKFVIESAEAVRYRDIHRSILNFEPQIVHFSGHGAGEPGLVFEDNAGKQKLVDAEALAGLFELFADQVECVLLNACYSEIQAQAIAQHLDYVIGMSHEIGDQAAIEFAVGFYDALGAGRTVEFAYQLGCNAILMAGIPEHLTPVLKSRKTILENNCYKEIRKPGSLIRIKKPPKLGETALLNRILKYAKQQDYQTVSLNFQDADVNIIDNLDRLLQWLCSSINHKLNLADNSSDYWENWRNRLGSKVTCTHYLEEHLLPQIPNAIALGFDWQKLRLIVVHSKDAEIPLNINQSPFNVGLTIEIPPN